MNTKHKVESTIRALSNFEGFRPGMERSLRAGRRPEGFMEGHTRSLAALMNDLEDDAMMAEVEAFLSAH